MSHWDVYERSMCARCGINTGDCYAKQTFVQNNKRTLTRIDEEVKSSQP